MLLALLLITARGQEPPPRKAQDPPAVTILEVRAAQLSALPTARLSYNCAFDVVRVVHDAAKLTQGEHAQVRDNRFTFRLYQGADRQDGKDAFERLSTLLKAYGDEPNPERERRFTIDYKDTMTLTIVRRPNALDLLIFERADGGRATLSLQKG
ncbi:MAG TPA: hypothetical protein VFD82_19900 [Planctomycetota bacterium]|nr:hypothetical protein [Planctomycetota bacterium]